MSNWKQSENKAYDWFKKNIDPYAIHQGEENSFCGDIYSPLYNSYIEVKDISNGARCGQFTEFTIKNNPFAQALFEGKTDSSFCRQFIQYHYTNKNVTHFIIIDNGQINFYSLCDFLEKYNFKLQTPYNKRSGTRKAPKKDIELLLKADKDFVLNEEGQVCCHDLSRWGEYFSLEKPFDYFISKNNGGVLRKRSTTQNTTWHLLIQKK